MQFVNLRRYERSFDWCVFCIISHYLFRCHLQLSLWYGLWFIIEGCNGTSRILNSTVIWWLAVSWTIMPQLLFLYSKQFNMLLSGIINKEEHIHAYGFVLQNCMQIIGHGCHLKWPVGKRFTSLEEEHPLINNIQIHLTKWFLNTFWPLMVMF